MQKARNARAKAARSHTPPEVADAVLANPPFAHPGTEVTP
jgi:hypothetical protein